MSVDWYTTIFKIINFLILVFLLRYFLYGPITRIMDEREKDIVNREDEAEKRLAEAAEEKELYQRKSDELETREEELLDKAREAAREEKSRLFNQARAEIEETRQSWKSSLAREKDHFLTELRERIGREACSIAMRVIKDLSDTEMQVLVWNQFVRKVDELPDEERSLLTEAVAGNEGRILLVSAFKPAKTELDQLEKVLNNLVSDRGVTVNLTTETDSKLICGLELDVASYHLAWNVNSYLAGVEEQIMNEFAELKKFTVNGEDTADD